MNLQSSLIEGLTNEKTDKPDTVYNNSVNSIAANAATYAASIKSQMILLQDELLISKYKKDYENVIINMDDYVNMLILKQVLKIKPNDYF